MAGFLRLIATAQRKQPASSGNSVGVAFPQPRVEVRSASTLGIYIPTTHTAASTTHTATPTTHTATPTTHTATPTTHDTTPTKHTTVSTTHTTVVTIVDDAHRPISTSASDGIDMGIGRCGCEYRPMAINGDGHDYANQTHHRTNQIHRRTNQTRHHANHAHRRTNHSWWLVSIGTRPRVICYEPTYHKARGHVSYDTSRR